MLSDFLDWLPPESATKTAMRDDMDPAELAELAREPAEGYGPWSGDRSMLAEIRDSVERVVYAVIRANGGKTPPPEPYPRPGVVKAADKHLDRAAIEYLERLRAAQAKRQAIPPPQTQKEAAVLYLDRLRQAHAARQKAAAHNPPAASPNPGA